MELLTTFRKKQISDLADYLSSEYSNSGATSLEKIILSENLPVHYDNYEDSFDGMLLYDGQHFHIHINIDKGNRSDSRRGRFTLAHELGHYFIDEHRIGLMRGTLLPHPSQHSVNNDSQIEAEADYFASCLLMPREKFRKQSGHKEFSLGILYNLSNFFQVSLLATVQRFAELGTHEVMVVISEENKVKRYIQSQDFPKWPFKFKVGQILPPTTVAGEFFSKINSKSTDIEDVSPDNWFYPKWRHSNMNMHEQCYYSDSYNYVISIIWFD